MDDRERLLDDYTRACGDVARLETELERAHGHREALRTRLRAALAAAPPSGTAGPVSSSAQTVSPRRGVQENVARAAQTVREFGRPVSATDLSQALQISTEQARNRLIRAASAGLLARKKRGQYCAINERATTANAELDLHGGS